MLIHRLTGDVPQPHLVIDSDLGFVINLRLTPVDHYSELCQKTYWILRKKLVQTLILSHVSYSNVVYAHVDNASSRKLGVAFNACLRYVHGLRRRDGVSELQTSITGVTLNKEVV
jgi:hypothetical protein